MTNLLDEVNRIVHEPTQQRANGGTGLTVTGVYTIDSPGYIDLGGGELESAGLTPHPRVWRDPGDDCQWWELSAGTHLIEYNESLTDETLLQPRPGLVERGGSHLTLRVTELPRVPLSVGGARLRLEANARVSSLLPV